MRVEMTDPPTLKTVVSVRTSATAEDPSAGATALLGTHCEYQMLVSIR